MESSCNINQHCNQRMHFILREAKRRLCVLPPLLFFLPRFSSFLFPSPLFPSFCDCCAGEEHMMNKLMGVVERLQQELFRADAARLAAER